MLRRLLVGFTVCPDNDRVDSVILEVNDDYDLMEDSSDSKCLFSRLREKVLTDITNVHSQIYGKYKVYCSDDICIISVSYLGSTDSNVELGRNMTASDAFRTGIPEPF